MLLKFLSCCYSCCCCWKERVTTVATGVVGGSFVLLTTNQAGTNEVGTLESRCQNLSLSPILFLSPKLSLVLSYSYYPPPPPPTTRGWRLLNCAPCHLPNLDPTIIMSTWIPPLDYTCQVWQRTNDADQMLLCDNCNGGYHLLCLKPKLTQVPVGIWYFSSCSPTASWLLLRPCHDFPGLGLGGGYMRISSQPPLCIVYICVCMHIFSVD
jgi:hypothetical protein